MHSLILLPLLALAATPAWSACDEPSSGSTSRAHIVTSASGDGAAIEQSVGVSIVNGKASVTLNGRPVPDARIKRDGSRLVILDERGKPIENMPFIQVESDGNGQDARVVVRSVATGGSAGASSGSSASSASSSNASASMAALQEALLEATRAGGAAVAHGQRAWVEAQNAARDEARSAGDAMKRYLMQLHRDSGDVTAQVVVAPPKVMLGVNLDEPNEPVLRQLRLEPGSATIMASVIDGLPASKAGLEAFDVVVEVDGQRPAGPQRLREVIAAKNPGDPLRLTVIRGGATRQFEVTLEPYDAARLGNQVAVTVEGGEAGQGSDAVPGEWRRSLQGFDIQIEPYLHQLRDALRFAPLPRDPNAAADPAAPRDFVYELRVPPGGDAGAARGLVLTPSAQPGTPMDTEAAQRLDRLEKRLDDMSRKLERLLEKLERLDA